MRLPKFRVRTLLVVVAIAGLAIGSVIMTRRRGDFLTRARAFADREDRAWRAKYDLSSSLRNDRDTYERYREIHRKWPPSAMSDAMLRGKKDTVEETERLLAAVERDINYCYAMRRKYERVARYPFLHVPTDPPSPPEPRRAGMPFSLYGTPDPPLPSEAPP